MKILGLDFEATGDDAKNDHITEVGARELILNGNTYQPGAGLQQFVFEPGYPKLSEFIQELTGITDKMLEDDGIPPKEMMEKHLFPMMEKVDYVLAHNKSYDQTLLHSVATRYGLTPPNKPWICTYTEIPYADKYKCKKLAHLALDHGLKMDGRSLHRALDDVELMLELVTTKYNFKDILVYASSPWVYLRAIIPAPWTDGGVGKQQATKLGYSWQCARGTEKPVFEKCWVKRVKDFQKASEIANAPFKVVVLDDMEKRS
jgi:inhibitor of KinA sporulation pathway (predicted exonuclease)